MTYEGLNSWALNRYYILRLGISRSIPAPPLSIASIIGTVSSFVGYPAVTYGMKAVRFSEAAFSNAFTIASAGTHVRKGKELVLYEIE
jgi:hypothetical protein